MKPLDLIMEFCDNLGIIIYSIGILLWPMLWNRLIGIQTNKNNKLLWLPFFGVIFVFTINILLAYHSRISGFMNALTVYSYVEQNATTISSMALAIAIFVVVEFRGTGLMLEEEKSRLFLSLVLWAFFFAMVGCLPLYWIPAQEKWLLSLRDMKTIPFTYSLFILSSAIIIFIKELNKTNTNL